MFYFITKYTDIFVEKNERSFSHFFNKNICEKMREAFALLAQADKCGVLSPAEVDKT